jgi:HK97 family phage major capsid protein
MGENSGVVGGYLVPLDYSLALMKVISEESFIYPRAHKVPMLAAETLCPRIDVETAPASAGISPFFGGIVFKWGSSQAPQETEPTFRQLSLKAWDLLGYATVSNDWLGDTGPDGEAAVVELFGKAAAWYAEYAFLQGTGTAAQMPLGILKAGQTKAVARAGGNAVAAADVANMTAALLPASWPRAIWACSPTVKAQLVKISTYFLNACGLEPDGRHYSLDGIAGYVTEKLPPLGTAGDLILFDPWLYVIGVRQEVLVDVSPHSRFQTNQTDFRIWMRMDGKPQVSGQITLQDTSTVVSPYVLLAA